MTTELYNFIGLLVSSLAWPVTILTLLGIVYRNQVKDLLERIKEATLPGGTRFLMGFNRATNAAEERSGDASPDSNDARWERTGNLFWLTHDLLRAISVISLERPKDEIVDMLNKSRYHATQLNINDSILARIHSLYDNAVASPEIDWTSAKREYFVQELSNIFGSIADLATKNQPDYGR